MISHVCDDFQEKTMELLRNGNELRSIDSNALQIIVAEINVLSVLKCWQWDLKQSLEWILDKYLRIFL